MNSYSLEKFSDKNTPLEPEKLFIRLYTRLNLSLDNNTNFLLGTDLLRYEVKQNLFKHAISTVEVCFLDMLQKKQQVVSVAQSRLILADLIVRVGEVFLNSQYGIKIKLDASKLHRSSNTYLQTLYDDADILVALPFSSLLNNKSQIFRSIFTPVYEIASVALIESLFENLIIALTSGVIIIISTEFSLVPNIRQNLYKSNFLSIRNIEQFKNKLAWQNRLKQYVIRPKNLYNSEYSLFVIRTDGIYSRPIYANRMNELLELNSVALFVVNYIELQDFIVARSNGTLLLVGKGTQYFFTSVVGRAIGLIWKGVLDGLKK